jgi:23S rRNA pseudouridine2604 synthase
MEFPIRINKYLAESGVTTRRGADTLIDAGKVFVNGKKALLGQQITKNDVVTLAGSAQKKHRYYLYYKPRGVITHSPEEHETDIETHIQSTHGLTGVFPIGRLDKDSEGLMLLTDDGRVTKHLLNPESKTEKEYEVTVDKRVTGTFLKKIEQGVNIEGYQTKPAVAVQNPKDERSFTLTITEGKKHQIRRMCAALGYQVLRLRRVRILSFSLRPLTEGNIRALSENEVTRLLKTFNITQSR